MNNVYNKMVKKKVTLTLEPKAIVRLDALAKKHKRSMSNMVEILIFSAYEDKDKDKIQHTIAKETVDELDLRPKQH